MRAGRGDSSPERLWADAGTACIGGAAAARVESTTSVSAVSLGTPRAPRAQYRLTTNRCTVAVQFLSLSGTPRRL
jgi:hypothetical protein